MNPYFCQRSCVLNRDAYLKGCVLKREITVLTKVWIFVAEGSSGFPDLATIKFPALGTRLSFGGVDPQVCPFDFDALAAGDEVLASLEEVTSTLAFPFAYLRVTKVKPSLSVELARLGSKCLVQKLKMIIPRP